MPLHATSWERHLMGLAAQGLEHEPPAEPVAASPETLGAAYAHCNEIALTNSRTFALASQLLPEAQRQAARALYAFCRITDDLIDQSNGAAAELADWRACALASPPPCDDPVALAWADTRHRFRIPARYAEQLVQGVAADLSKTRYANFDELAAYCYGVASTVGLMAMSRLDVAAHRLLQDVDQQIVIDRLFEVINRIRFQSRAGGRRIAVRCDEYHRQQTATMTQRLLQLQPIHAGHADIKHCTAGPLEAQSVEKIFGAGKHRHAVTASAKQQAHAVTRERIVVDDKNGVPARIDRKRLSHDLSAANQASTAQGAGRGA